MTGEGFAFFCWRRLQLASGEGCCLQDCWACRVEWGAGKR